MATGTGVRMDARAGGDGRSESGGGGVAQWESREICSASLGSVHLLLRRLRTSVAACWDPPSAWIQCFATHARGVRRSGPFLPGPTWRKMVGWGPPGAVVFGLEGISILGQDLVRDRGYNYETDPPHQHKILVFFFFFFFLKSENNKLYFPLQTR